MRNLFFIAFLIALAGGVSGQNYNYANGWINYNQQYYKIKLYQEGIYRLDSALLANAGINVGSVDCRNFQVFIRGTEQFIHIEDANTNNVLDASDYIEFYGNKNDAVYDSAMYDQTAFLINPWYSVIQDTAVAFLTWNSSTNNKRYVLQNDLNFSAYSPAQWFYSLVVNTNRIGGYFVGGYNAIGQVDSRYKSCEGWTDYGPPLGTTKTIEVHMPKLFTGGGVTQISAVYLSSSSNQQLITNSLGDHHFKMMWKDRFNNLNLLRDTIFWGYKSFRDVASINSGILDDTLEFQFSNINHSVYTSNSCRTGYFSVYYPHSYDLSGVSSIMMHIPDALAPQSKTYAKFYGYTQMQQGGLVKAFDLTNGNIFYPLMNNGVGEFLIPNGGVKKVWLTSSDKDVPVSQLSKVNGTGFFVDYLAQNNTDSAFVIITHPKFINEAGLYKQFRSSASGGNYNVILSNVYDLYDQFAYGLEKHPLAIRNFMKFLLDSASSKPRYLFLIGKSVPSYRGLTDALYYQRNLLPSWGDPCSDNLILAGLNGTFLEPAVPTGRLAATTPQEVINYLDKVKMHDTVSVSQWQKNVAHFVGGYTPNDQSLFSFYMNSYKQIIQDTLYGANVTTFIKNTSAPIQTSIPDSVINLINSGLSLITFYGHSSNQSFDFDLNDPNRFSNFGKYPLILSNSCYTGDIHLYDTVSLSEKYVFTKDKGAIAFIGSASTGVAQYLNLFSNNFYKALSVNQYGKGIGDIMKSAIIPTQNFIQTADEIEKITCMDITLHGDPAVRINPSLKPDFAIYNQDLVCKVNPFSDSIDVTLHIRNLSRAVKDSMRVLITRTYPDGSKEYLVDTIPSPYYSANYQVTFPVKTQKGGIGLNYFTAQIDDLNDIDEADNTFNNKVENIALLVNGDDIIPVYPYEFEVLPLTSNIILKASTADPFALSSNYVFQIDTTDKFLNPLTTATLTAVPGGLVEWNVSLLNATPTDSVVYFWRVSRDSTGPQHGFNWRESSFQLIDNKFGWGQSHFYQFKKNRRTFVDYLKSLRQWEFSSNKNAIAVKQGFYPFWGGSVLPVDLLFNYNSRVEHAASTADNGWSFFVIDTTTALFDTNTIQGTTYQYGTSNHCLCGNIVYYDFGTNNTLHPGFVQNSKSIGDSIASFLNALPADKWVLGYSNNFWRGVYNNANGGGPQFDTSFYNAMDNFGVPGNATLINTPDTQAVVFLGRKGLLPGTAHVEIGSNKKSIINFQDTIVAHWDEGYILSPLIGPAKKWNSVHWRFSSLESVSQDSVKVKLYGIDANGQSTLLHIMGHTEMDLLNLDVLVDASIYPFIRLEAVLSDDPMRTAPQLNRWHVMYDPVPEGALYPSGGYTIVGNSLQEGDSVRVIMPFKNISDFTFIDSLAYTYWIEDGNNIKHFLPGNLKADSLAPGMVIFDTVRASTFGFAGALGLWMHVNAKNHPRYQYEQASFNNIAKVPFSVSRDVTNPLLDVTFDGIHILNKDIVSSRPEILITLKDENKFLALNDTSDFEVYLSQPNSNNEKRIWFCPGCINGSITNAVLQFDSAKLPDNSCKIVYKPELVTDGFYTLRVRAKDKSSNQSGASDFVVQFEVQNKASVTQVMNYPNPFSTSTRFVFTLTGHEVPETFMIQVMTISGKVVREILRDELGPIRIGRNITEFSWDGTDEFGDRLANGVYLYRVVTRLNGEKIENRESGADAFFTNELGKMVIIR